MNGDKTEHPIVPFLLPALQSEAKKRQLLHSGTAPGKNT
jgi:hypothetical protein